MAGVGSGASWTHRPTYLRDQWHEISLLPADGRPRSIMGETFPLDRAADALHAIDERRAIGNLMLEVR